jgi:hypothetical protein
MSNQLNCQQKQQRSLVLLRPPCSLHFVEPLALLPMYGLSSWCEMIEGMALNSHGRLYTCDSQTGANRSGLRVVRSDRAEADYRVWQSLQQGNQSLRSLAADSLGCEGEGRAQWRNLAATPADQAVYKQIGDNYFASRDGSPLRTGAQRALMALDNIADCPFDPAYFDSPQEWISWAKKRAQDQATELRAALAAEIATEKGNKS